MRNHNKLFQQLMIVAHLLLILLLKSCSSIESNPQSEKMKSEPDSIDLNKKIAYLEEQLEALKISQKGCAKAWVIFNGKGPTILDSYNVSSVIKNNTGDYTIKFTTPFSTNNYCSMLSTGNGPHLPNYPWVIAIGPYYDPPKRDKFRLYTYTDSYGVREAADILFISACFYGN